MGTVMHGLNIKARAATYKRVGPLWWPVQYWESSPTNPIIRLAYQWTHMRPDGSVFDQTSWVPMNSLLEQFIQGLRIQWTQANLAMIDTGSVSRTNTQSNINFNMTAAAANTTRSLVVGLSSTAVALTDRALGSKIAEGTGTDQLNYQAATLNAPANPTGNEVEITMTRRFNNNSAANIAVAEIGVEADMRSTVPATNSFLMVREVSAQTILTGNTAILTVRIYATATAVLNFFQSLYTFTSQANVASITDAGGTVRTLGLDNNGMRADGATEGTASASGVRGIVVGTGTGAFSPTGTALGTYINSGTSAGRLAYYTDTFGAIAANRRFFHRRSFFNTSGGSIIIGEFGAHIRQDITGGLTSHFLMFRTLPTALTVANNGSGVFEYTIEI